MRDDAPIPPTLSDLAHDVNAVVCWCNRCHHCGLLLPGEAEVLEESADQPRKANASQRRVHGETNDGD